MAGITKQQLLLLPLLLLLQIVVVVHPQRPPPSIFDYYDFLDIPRADSQRNSQRNSQYRNPAQSHRRQDFQPNKPVNFQPNRDVFKPSPKYNPSLAQPKPKQSYRQRVKPIGPILSNPKPVYKGEEIYSPRQRQQFESPAQSRLQVAQSRPQPYKKPVFLPRQPDSQWSRYELSEEQDSPLYYPKDHLSEESETRQEFAAENDNFSRADSNRGATDKNPYISGEPALQGSLPGTRERYYKGQVATVPEALVDYQEQYQEGRYEEEEKRENVDKLVLTSSGGERFEDYGREEEEEERWRKEETAKEKREVLHHHHGGGGGGRGGGGHLDANGREFVQEAAKVEQGKEGDGRLAFQIHGQNGPHSYRFGYDTGKGHNRQFRYEERAADGQVHGRYGFYGNDGKLQIVNYSAHPKHGFSADV